MTPVLGAVVTGGAAGVLVWCATAPWRGPRTPRTTGRQHVGPVPPPGADDLGAAAVDPTVVLDLLGAALGAGAGVPRALGAVGRSVRGQDGEALERAGAALLLGAGWEPAWEGAPARLRPVSDALRPAWVHGAPPRDALRVARERIAHDARTRARTAAARLGVRLVLPLGLCLLPAFVLLGLVPVVVALGSGLGGGT